MKVMTKINEAVGIDVSKHTLDAHLHLLKQHQQFSNDKKGFIALLKWVKEKTGLPVEQVLFCFEHTGLYSFCLAGFLSEHKLRYAMVPALNIKRSLGITRGKNDQVDAKRIAEYAYMRGSKLKQTQLPSKQLIKLKQQLALRERMVTQRAGYQASLKEYKLVFEQEEYPELFHPQIVIIQQLNEHIAMIEKQMQRIIKEDETMNHLYQLITSVKGIGLILAAHFLVITNCFTTFEDGRKFACYCGTAPFEKQSGTSLKTKARVSHYANKTMKMLLHLGAASAIQCDPEIRNYYQRRIAEGKSKMSTLNIVRNKLVHRVFAVVKRQSPYVVLNQYAA